MPLGDLPAHPLEPHQALALVKLPNRRYRTGRRDRAMLAIMWRCGLRCAEVCDLSVADMKTSKPRSLTVLRPKGSARGKPPRTAGLDEQTYALIVDWLEMRGIEPGPLFNTVNNTKLATRNVRRMVSSRGRKLGLNRRVHPHCLRHSFTRDLYYEGVGMIHIQRALGHSSLATTAQYLQTIGCDDAVAITSERTLSAK